MQPTRWTLIVLLAWLGTSCNGATCTAMGWEDMLTVEFEPALDAIGTWKLEFSNGHDATCEVTLPMEDEETREYFSCETNGEGYLEIRFNSDYTLRYARIMDNPDSVDLRVSRNGVVLFDETLVPDYEKRYPYGSEDCGTQYSAMIKIDVY